MIPDEIAVFWFRRDLRLEDNHGLCRALTSGMKVLPIFIFDPEILKNLEDKSDRRVDLIFQALDLMNGQLRDSFGSGIQYFYGKPNDVFAELTSKHNVRAVFCNVDYEPYPVERDRKVKEFLRAKGIQFSAFKDHVIFHEDEILKQDGNPYTVYTPYSKVWLEKFNQARVKSFESENLLEHLVNFRPNNFDITSIGFEKTDLVFVPTKINETLIANYHNTRNLLHLENGTSELGAHLRFGITSARALAKKALGLNQFYLKELIWREFFMQVLWHFPHVVIGSFKPKYDKIEWDNDEKLFKRWCEGTTGFSAVDAGMRQLNATGFMHNRARMITASFLTKHLLIDWRWGEAYFASKLLDYELSSNNGNWQWTAGSGCDAAPYFRIFNPEEQQKKFDPDFVYARRWIPEFGTRLYPQPIIDHKMARVRALERFKVGLKEIYL